jgi:hypothetical protein
MTKEIHKMNVFSELTPPSFALLLLYHLLLFFFTSTRPL